jgi:hypothetical protein
MNNLKELLELRKFKVFCRSLNDLRHTVNSGLGVGAASRHWSARLELGDSGEIHRVPGVARTSSKWNRRF